jgi:alpha-N-arabinofuranosidase
MKEISVVINKNFYVGIVDKRLFGSFAEHMGRVVYGGLFDKNNKKSDDKGYRKDVIDAVKKAGITQVRYPGGNFVSNYFWEDGVGPISRRNPRLDLAWKAIETNEFGTDEFIKWTGLANVKPMLAVNLGTRGIADAVNYLEYCNLDTDTKYSRMRAEFGHEEPYGVKTWCLGNEMDGEWQIGHKTAHEYGRLAAETSKAMKILDPSIETVLCGSSLVSMPTFPSWEATVLDEAYDHVDYISLHQYYGGQEKGTEIFLSQADEMLESIRDVQATIRYIKSKHRSKKDVKISLDEWGIWTRSSCMTDKETDECRWSKSPAISEMYYSFEDSLLFAEMLMAMLKSCNIVKIACQSLITNISSMIMVNKDDIWLQSTYYPFMYIANNSEGCVLESKTDDREKMLDIVTVYNDNKKEISIFAVNRNVNEDITVNLDLQGFTPDKVVDHVVITSKDIKATNRVDHSRIEPHESTEHKITGEKVLFEMSGLSWCMLKVKTE